MAHPDLQIRGSGGGGGQAGGHPDPEIRAEGARQASVVWSKNKGGGGVAGPQTPPLDSPHSPLFFSLTSVSSLHSFGIISQHKRNNRPFQGLFLFCLFVCLFVFFILWHGQVRKNPSTPLKKNAFKLVKLLILKMIC